MLAFGGSLGRDRISNNRNYKHILSTKLATTTMTVRTQNITMTTTRIVASS